MDLRTVTLPHPAAAAAASLPLNPIRSTTAIEAGPIEGPTLGPAALVSIGEGGSDPSEAERRGYARDPESQALVYQVVDAQSGEVVVQIPDDVVLRARAYAEAAEVRARPAERPVDRTA